MVNYTNSRYLTYTFLVVKGWDNLFFELGSKRFNSLKCGHSCRDMKSIPQCPAPTMASSPSPKNATTWYDMGSDGFSCSPLLMQLIALWVRSTISVRRSALRALWDSTRTRKASPTANRARREHGQSVLARRMPLIVWVRDYGCSGWDCQRKTRSQNSREEERCEDD